MAAFYLGDSEQASDWLAQVVRRNPEDGEDHYNYGVALKSAGKLLEASEAFQRAVQKSPAKIEAYNNLGLVLGRLSRNDEAMEAYTAALEVDPVNQEILNNVGLLLLGSGSEKEAEKWFLSALETVPDNPFFCINLGNIYKQEEQFDRAIDYYQRALHVRPGDVIAQNNLGAALLADGQVDEAEAAYKKVLQIDANNAEAFGSLGNLYFEKGQTEPAIENLRRAIALSPSFAEFHYSLSRMKKFKRHDPDLVAIEKLLEESVLSDEELSYLNFAAAKAYADLGDDDVFFSHLEKANFHHRKFEPYDAKADEERVDRIIAFFDPSRIKTDTGADPDSVQPVFILGMPRSGTSLVEQILASHPQVRGAGELPYLALLTRERLHSPYPEGLRDFTDQDYRDFARAYLDLINKKSPDAPLVTDKMPANFRYIGLIRLAFPQARIIHCVRDPMDIGFSCYKQHFATGLSFAYDQKDIAHYYRLYEKLMAHWRTLFPNDIYDFVYEDHISNPPESTRRLLSYCGLEWDERCLDFHKTQRAVRTASAAQVRKPIYKDSVKSWLRFQDQLTPMKSALESEA